MTRGSLMGQEWRGSGMWAALLYSFDVSCLLSMKENFLLASSLHHIIPPPYMQHACHMLCSSQLLMVLAAPESTLSKDSLQITPSHKRVSGDPYLLERGTDGLFKDSL